MKNIPPYILTKYKHFECLYCLCHSVSVAQVVQLVISGFINVPLCMDGQHAKLAFSFLSGTIR